MANHVYWRLYFTSASAYGGSSNATTVAEWKVFDGSSVQIATTGGTPSASSTAGGTTTAGAFDANNATIWASSAAASNASPQWLKYQFASGVDIVSFSITSRSSGSLWQSPVDFALQYSDDDSAWTTLYQYYGVGWTSAAQSITFTASNCAPSSLVIAYRLLITDSFVAGSTSIAEWLLYDGTGTLITTGKYAALNSSQVDGEANSRAQQAFDASNSTYWAGDAAGHPTSGAPQWLQYRFDSSVAVGSFSIRARNDGSNYQQTPTSFSLQSSPDGTTWTGIQAYSASTWSSGQVQTFTVGTGTGGSQPCPFIVT